MFPKTMGYSRMGHLSGEESEGEEGTLGHFDIGTDNRGQEGR